MSHGTNDPVTADNVRYEQYGLEDARRVNYPDTCRLTVSVSAYPDHIRLHKEAADPAGLTPDQARYLARKLYRCARLVEQRLTKGAANA